MSNPWLEDYSICKEMGWTWDELQNIQEEVVVAFSRIASLRARMEEVELQKAEKEVRR